MESIFDWGGEQMALYLGEAVGELLVITLNKCVNKVPNTQVGKLNQYYVTAP